MTVDGAGRGRADLEKSQSDQADSAALARRLVRSQRKAALATLDRSSGHPHASLVTVATEPDGTPLLLISRLAVHTQNLLADARASLLFDGTDLKGDPLAGGRVTVIGEARPTASETARRRFLAKQPEAGGYADFPDFSFYALERGAGPLHWRLRTHCAVAGADLIFETAASRRADRSGGRYCRSHERDHGDAVLLYATALAGAPAAEWRMTGLDPEGIDLADAAADLPRPFGAPVEISGGCTARASAAGGRGASRTWRIIGQLTALDLLWGGRSGR